MTQIILVVASYISLMTGMLLLIGAARKVWLFPHRLNRLQLEGSALMMLGLLLRLVFFDPFFGRDPLMQSALAFWLNRGEHGLFLLGFILFGLGFYLQQRPRPGLEPWPSAWKRAAWATLTAGLLLAAFFLLQPLHAIQLPWRASRTCFMLGLLVFAKIYCYLAFTRPAEADRIINDIITLEDS